MQDTKGPGCFRKWRALWVSALIASASVLVPIGSHWLASRNNLAIIKLPTVDISPFLNQRSTPAQLHRVARQITNAASTTGCFFLVGHGFTLLEQTATLAAAHELMHGVSPTARQALAVKPGKLARGYVPLAGESGSAELVEVKEGFSFGYEWAPNEKPRNVLQGPNVWPQATDGFSIPSKKHVSLTLCLPFEISL
jgi:isopenicillin N synthase-like dioxygenase